MRELRSHRSHMLLLHRRLCGDHAFLPLLRLGVAHRDSVEGLRELVGGEASGLLAWRTCAAGEGFVKHLL